MIKCKCGNEDKSLMLVEEQRKHNKVSCGVCGKYIKFANKEEVTVLRFNGGKFVKGEN